LGNTPSKAGNNGSVTADNFSSPFEMAKLQRAGFTGAHPEAGLPRLGILVVYV
jgi:hypothetical protein